MVERTYTYTHRLTQVHAHTRSYTIHTHTHSHAHNTHTRTRRHTRTHARTHVRTHARTHAHTHTHTHTHTHRVSNVRCPGVITNGGVKPNIIPEKAELLYYIRAPTLQARDILATKVYACFNAAATATATATGCSVRIVTSYSNDTCRKHTATARMRVCIK